MPQDSSSSASSESSHGRLAEVAWVFLKLGTTAFGGPAAHIAMMEDEFVRRRKWLTHEQFLDMLGAVNLIPGPNSTEMAIYVGYLRAGWPGLLLGGVCFVLPAMLIVMALAWGYTVFGSLPQIAGLLRGVKPVVIAIIVQALVGLAPKAIKSRGLGLMALAAVVASLAGLDPLSLVLACGLVGAVAGGARTTQPRPWSAMIALGIVVAGLLVAMHWPGGISPPAVTEVADEQAAVVVGQSDLFLYFLKIGSILYGSGYVLLAFLQGDLVHRWHWLGAQELLDATAVGQVTPGPLFTTATFIGFLLGHRSGGLESGLAGAVVATLGIFLPSFVFIALGSLLFPRLRKSALAGAFLDGVNVAAVAMIAATTWNLGREALVDVATVVIALASGLVLIRYRVNSAWLVLGGAIAGLLLSIAA